MHYPWWYVPAITSPMLIAIIAVLHVLVAHYAVGGGFFLAVETAYAYKTNDREYLAYLRKHAQFFILLTVVFGAITGVGIWWTIGLASPLATELLIRTFVFGWATEWVFFVLEITSAFIFFYWWGHLRPKTHIAMGWIYAWAAWISLVLITGITAFMLHPGDWLEKRTFWSGFLNPQFIPQTLARTGGAFLLSSLYVYLHASICASSQRLHDLVEQRSTRPALLGAVLIVAGGVGWYINLPQSAREALFAASALNIFVGLIFVSTGAVFVLLLLGPLRKPGWIRSPGFAAALLAFGVIAFATGEFIREAIRKPYVVYNVVFGNQIYAEQAELDRLRTDGYLEGGVWTRQYVRAHYPQLVVGGKQEDGRLVGGKIDRQRLLALPQPDRQKLGAVIFMYHCNDCHALGQGYSAAGPLMQGWTRPMVREMIDQLHTVRFVMPPWCGTPEEAELLADFLMSIAPPRPAGMQPEPIMQEPIVQPAEQQTRSSSTGGGAK